MAKKNSSSWRSKLNIFANSPKFVKLFGPLVILLIVGALGYGGYTLLKENSSDASFKDKTWRLNGKGIGHSGGSVYKYKINGDEDNTRPTWWATPNNKGQLVWWGPYIDLPSGQYVGCVYYAFQKAFGGRATFDITNKFGSVKLREITLYNDPGGSNFRFPREDDKFSKTCLAFYVPKYMKNTDIELRIRHLEGNMFIRQTKIMRITSKNSEVSNGLLFNRFPDNKSLLHSSGYTL